MSEFKMPDIGEGVMEGEVVKWLVKEGDDVTEDQPLVEVMTDKATVVIPCPTRGVVDKIRVGEGRTARVGEALVSFRETGAAAPKAPPPQPRAEAPRAPSPPPVQPVAAAVPRPSPAAHENGRRAVAAPAAVPSPAGRAVAAPVAVPSPAGRALAAPATRRMAREAGVDLAQVSGTGPSGRITRGDLESFLEEKPAEAFREEGWPGEVQPPPAPPVPTPQRVQFAPGPRPEQRVPMRGLRKRISERMRQSKDHAAHFTYVEECDATELVRLRNDLEGLAKEKGVRLTYLPFIVKAVVSALQEFPYMNASYDEEAQEIVLKGYYNIGVAASNDEGLVVPVLKDCDRRTVLELASEIQYLGDAAKHNRLKVEELQGSTFTISSLGAIGGLFATPVIYYPEVAILGVHKIRKRPVVKDDAIVIRDIVWLSCSIDHRVVDGHVGAAFVQRLVRLLEDPRLLLLGA